MNAEVLSSERLGLYHLTADDAAFILELVNEPDWLRFIGDRNIHDLEAARAYIERGPRDMYARLGFGLYKVALKDGTLVGMCGLIKRDGLDDVDIGFAFLARHRGRGYAHEAAAATLRHARALGLKRLVAITAPDNGRSVQLLEKLGFVYRETLRLPQHGGESRLFALQL